MGIKQLLIVAKHHRPPPNWHSSASEAGAVPAALVDTCEEARSVITRQRLDAILLGFSPLPALSSLPGASAGIRQRPGSNCPAGCR